MSRFLTIVLGFGLGSLILLSIVSSSLGYKLEHKPEQNMYKKNNVETQDDSKHIMHNGKNVNEINYCIMGCVKCANGDLYFKEESVSIRKWNFRKVLV